MIPRSSHRAGRWRLAASPRRSVALRRLRTAAGLRRAHLAPAFLVLAGTAASQELVLRGPDPAVVRPGGEARVALVLAGAGEARLEPPRPVDGLSVAVGDPEATDHQAVIDGEVRELPGLTWELVLRPAHAGRFELPPLRVQVGGDVLRSDPVVLECALDQPVGPHAFVEVRAERATCFVQERFPLTLRLGIDLEFLSTRVVQLSARRLDVPVRLSVPWIDGLPRAEALPARAPSDRAGLPGPRGGLVREERSTFALNDGVAQGRRAPDEVRDGRPFLVLEIEREFRATRSGPLRVPAPSLVFAYASRVERGAFAVGSTEDWQLAHVEGAPLAIEVLPLPADGRPLTYGGAVGRFAVSAQAAPRDLALGQGLRLELAITGDGNLASFEPPRLEDLAGFRLRGTLDDRGAPRRTVVYDLAPTSVQVRAVPPIELPFFDPVERRYDAVATEPIPLRVRPADPPPAAEGQPGLVDPGGAPVPRGGLGESTVPEGGEPGGGAGRRGLVLAVALAAAGLLFAVLVGLRPRAAAGRAASGGARGRSAAARALQDVLADDTVATGDLLGPVTEFLAARLRCEPAAVVDRDLRARLERSGAPPELAARAAAAVDELVHARYGDTGHAPDRAELGALVEELDAAL